MKKYEIVEGYATLVENNGNVYALKIPYPSKTSNTNLFVDIYTIRPDPRDILVKERRYYGKFFYEYRKNIPYLLKAWIRVNRKHAATATFTIVSK